MFHAIWVWAGMLRGEKLPLMVESFVRLLGDKNTDWTLEHHTSDDAVLYWASLPATYHESLIKLMPLVFKLGVRKHLMIALVVGVSLQKALHGKLHLQSVSERSRVRHSH